MPAGASQRGQTPRPTGAVGVALVCGALALGCQLVPTDLGPAGRLPVASSRGGGADPSEGGKAEAQTGMGELVVRTLEPYRVQAFSDVISKVRFSISGPNLPGNKSFDIGRSEFGDGEVVARWSKVLPGPVAVSAAVLDSGDRVLADATGSVEVRADESAQVELRLVAKVRDVIVSFGLEVPVPSPTFFVGKP